MTDSGMTDSGMTDIWAEMQRPAPESVVVYGVELRRGSRVRLRPRARGDIFDQALSGRVGIIEGIDASFEGGIHVTVTLEDDPGRDLGDSRFPGHRFSFAADEIEPLETLDGSATPSRPPPRVLVAGIGNVFLGDDGFGVAVAQRLAERSLPTGVDAVDFGIRGMDLAYAMQGNYDAVVLVDAAPRGSAPGTLHVIDARVDADGPVAVDTHGMDPVKVLALARALGRVPARVLVVACEPERVISTEQWDEMEMGLTPPVSAAVDAAVELVEELVAELLAGGSPTPDTA